MKTYFNDLRLLLEVSLQKYVHALALVIMMAKSSYRQEYMTGRFINFIYRLTSVSIDLSDNAARGLSFVNRIVSPPRNSTAS